jgi:hypothetical protein
MKEVFNPARYSNKISERWYSLKKKRGLGEDTKKQIAAKEKRNAK